MAENNCYSILNDSEFSDSFKEASEKFMTLEGENLSQADFESFTKKFIDGFFTKKAGNVQSNSIARDALKAAITAKVESVKGMSHKDAILSFLRTGGVTGKGNTNTKNAMVSLEAQAQAGRKTLVVPLERELNELFDTGKISKETFDMLSDASFNEKLLEFNADMKRAMGGLETQNKEASEIAAVLKRSLKRANDAKKQAGIDEVFSNSYMGPQTHDRKLILQISLEDFGAKMRNWLNPEIHKDIFADPKKMEDLQLELSKVSFFNDKQRKFNSGENTINEDKFNRERQLFFKDAESEIAYDREFGRRGTVVNHVSQLMGKFGQDIAIRRNLGSNPEGTLSSLLEWAKKEDKRLYDSGKLKNAANKEINEKIDSRIQSSYDKVIGRNTSVYNEKIAKIGSSIRYFTSITSLGKIVLNSIGGDLANQSFHKSLRSGNNVALDTVSGVVKNIPTIFKRIAESLTPLKRKEILEELEYTTVALRDNFNSLMREQSEDQIFSILGGKFTKFFEFSSRMNKFTFLQERHYVSEQLQYRQDVFGKVFAELKPREKTYLDSIGVDEGVFNLLKSVRNAEDAKFIPTKVYDIPNEKINEHYKPEYDKLESFYDKQKNKLEALKKDLETKGNERNEFRKKQEETEEDMMGADYSDALNLIDDRLWELDVQKKQALDNFSLNKKADIERLLNASMTSQIAQTFNYRTIRTEEAFTFTPTSNLGQVGVELIKSAKQFKTFGISQTYSVLEKTLTHPDISKLEKFSGLAALAVIMGFYKQLTTWTQEFIAGKELSEFDLLNATMGSGALGIGQDILGIFVDGLRGVLDEDTFLGTGKPVAVGTKISEFGAGPSLGKSFKLLNTMFQQAGKEGDVNSAVVFDAIKGLIPGGNSIPMEFLLVEGARAFLDDYDYYKEKSMEQQNQKNIEGEQREMRTPYLKNLLGL